MADLSHNRINAPLWKTIWQWKLQNQIRHEIPQTRNKFTHEKALSLVHQRPGPRPTLLGPLMLNPSATDPETGDQPSQVFLVHRVIVGRLRAGRPSAVQTVLYA